MVESTSSAHFRISETRSKTLNRQAPACRALTMKKLVPALIIPVAVVGCWFAYAKLYSSAPDRFAVRVPVEHLRRSTRRGQLIAIFEDNEAAVTGRPRRGDELVLRQLGIPRSEAAKAMIWRRR